MSRRSVEFLVYKIVEEQSVVKCQWLPLSSVIISDQRAQYLAAMLAHDSIPEQQGHPGMSQDLLIAAASQIKGNFLCY